MTDNSDNKDFSDEKEFKIKGDFVRYFRINNLKTKDGKIKPNGTAYTVVYSYDPSIGRVRYGACKFTKTADTKSGVSNVFSKKAHRTTAIGRYTKYPIYFDICFDSDGPSQILHEVRTSIKKMIFTVGMKCRHSKDKAMTAQPMECELKYKTLAGSGAPSIRKKVTLLPLNAALTPKLPSSPTSSLSKTKKVEWDE